MALLLGAIALSRRHERLPRHLAARRLRDRRRAPHEPPAPRNARACSDTIAQVERPLYLIFLLVAGALWDPRAWQGWVLAPVFVLSRVGGKLIGAHVAKRTGPEELPDAGTLGLALAPQSPIAIATIVSYVTLYKPARGERRPRSRGS